MPSGREGGDGLKARIPERNRDLLRYVRRRRLAQLTGYVAFVAAFALGANAYNASHQTYPPEKQLLGWRLALWMLAALLIGFFLFRLWRFFTRCTVEGRILHAGLSHGYVPSDDPGAANAVSYDFRVHSYLTVEDEKGKRHRLRFEQKPGFYLYYYPGTRLCRFAGLAYPLCDPRSACRPERRRRAGEGDPHDDLSGGSICVACGLLNRSSEQVCGRCGLSLIDPAEVWKDTDPSL